MNNRYLFGIEHAILNEVTQRKEFKEVNEFTVGVGFAGTSAFKESSGSAALFWDMSLLVVNCLSHAAVSFINQPDLPHSFPVSDLFYTRFH